MRLLVRPRYLLIFAIRGKRKVGTLYSPTKGSLADYNQVQPVWIAELGANCAIADEGVKVGSKGYVIDSYEFEECGAVLWPSYREILPANIVAEIEKEAADFDGIISGNVVHEGSIFAIEEEESLCQTLKGSPSPNLKLVSTNSPSQACG